MLSRPPRELPPNPDDILIGVCGTCKTSVEVVRSEAGSTDRKEVGVSFWAANPWGNLPSAECPNCKAHIYLTKKT